MRQASDGESVGVSRLASMAKFLLGERLKAVKAKSVFSCPERYTRVRESTPIRQASAAANTAPSVGRLLFPQTLSPSQIDTETCPSAYLRMSHWTSIGSC